MVQAMSLIHALNSLYVKRCSTGPIRELRWLICDTNSMTAIRAPREGWEVFAHPTQMNQRRYEAERAYVLEGAPLAEAAYRYGYTPWALASLVRDFRAGNSQVFAEPGKPGRKSAPKKDAARDRVIELRREGLSVYEISVRLSAEGTPLNRTGVGQVLSEEGFGRLLRHPSRPRASLRPPPGGTPGCPVPRSSTSLRSRPRRSRDSRGSCWQRRTWSPSI